MWTAAARVDTVNVGTPEVWSREWTMEMDEVMLVRLVWLNLFV